MGVGRRETRGPPRGCGKSGPVAPAHEVAGRWGGRQAGACSEQAPCYRKWGRCWGRAWFGVRTVRAIPPLEELPGTGRCLCGRLCLQGDHRRGPS